MPDGVLESILARDYVIHIRNVKLNFAVLLHIYHSVPARFAMVKPTQPLYRKLQRLALTTKQVNGGYYKGTGSGSMGRHTKHGGYVIEWRKVRTYVVPAELKSFKV